MAQVTAVNSMVTDTATQNNTLVLGSAGAVHDILNAQAYAQAMALSLGNASAAQQASTSIRAAMVSSTCAAISAAGAAP